MTTKWEDFKKSKLLELNNHLKDSTNLTVKNQYDNSAVSIVDPAAVQTVCVPKSGFYIGSLPGGIVGRLNNPDAIYSDDYEMTCLLHMFKLQKKNDMIKELYSEDICQILFDNDLKATIRKIKKAIRKTHNLLASKIRFYISQPDMEIVFDPTTEIYHVKFSYQMAFCAELES